ncbi:MAG: S8 family serine peptidase, partial [Acidimicrobiales bacterium]
IRRAAAVPNDPGWPGQDHLRTLRFPEAWDVAKAGTPTVVAVVDSGVDLTHPDLAPRLVPGRDFVGNDAVPQDGHGHGTFVAGIVGAATDNGAGIAGASWGAAVMPVRVLGDDGAGTDIELISGIRWAADNGASIIVLALAGYGDNPSLRDAVDYAAGRNVVVVASAGNDGAPLPQYPAAYPSALAVGATDALGRLVNFSQHGPWLDLVAPGSGIASTALGGGYATGSGTSFSAPIVAGVAALVRTQNPAWSAAEVARRLAATAQDRGPVGLDDGYGFGVVDAWAAVGGPLPAPVPPAAGDGFEPNPTALRAVPIGASTSATTSPEGDVDWFAVDVASPSTVTVTVTPPLPASSDEPSGMDPMVAAYSPSERIIGSADFAGLDSPEMLQFPAVGAGRYLLRVANYAGTVSPGPYSVTVVVSAPGAVPLLPPAAFFPGSAGRSVAIGDVTGDGRPDIAYSSHRPNVTGTVVAHLTVVTWRSTGSLALVGDWALDGGTSGSATIGIGDLDGDGRNDLAVAVTTGIDVLLQGTGGLAGPALVPLPGGATHLDVGDIDPGGPLELVAATPSGIQVGRRAAGGWTFAVASADTLVTDITVGDVSGDGLSDIVAARCDATFGCGISVYRQLAGSAFAKTALQGEPADIVRGVAAGDVTGDGRGDAIVTSTAGRVLVFPQDGAGALGSPRFTPAGTPAGPVEVADLNRDGRLDVVALHPRGDQASVFLQTPDGNLGTPQPRAVRQAAGDHHPRSLALGDIDGDLGTDLVVMHPDGILSIVLQGPDTGLALWARATAPLDEATGVTRTGPYQLAFRAALEPASVTGATVVLIDGRSGAPVAATVTYTALNGVVSVSPAIPLAGLHPYQLRVSGVSEPGGRVMFEEELVNFVTAPAPPPASPPPPPPPAPARSGYWMVSATGAVYAFGDAGHYGNLAVPAAAPIVDIEATRAGDGYWLVDASGQVSIHGAARFFGHAGLIEPGETITSLSATPAGDGYWIFTSRGRVIPRGGTAHLGDMSAVALNGPVLDSIPTASGNGYFMVATDGGIFTFGDAQFHGSMGSVPLNAPVQSLVPDADGAGYWLVASDGGIFSFEAEFYGSMGSVRLNRPVTGMVGSGAGYLMVAEDGGVFTFGEAQFEGSLGDNPPPAPITSVSALA